MYAALQKIKALPDDVNFYPGHEYTIHAAAAAFHADPHNMDLRHYLQHADERLKQGLPVGPITLGEEKNCNPYLRAKTLDQLKKLI